MHSRLSQWQLSVLRLGLIYAVFSNSANELPCTILCDVFYRRIPFLSFFFPSSSRCPLTPHSTLDSTAPPSIRQRVHNVSPRSQAYCVCWKCPDEYLPGVCLAARAARNAFKLTVLYPLKKPGMPPEAYIFLAVSTTPCSCGL